MTYVARIKDYAYEWVPPHARFADLPPSTYTKETRTPRYVLSSRGGDDLDVLVYFVNLGEETIARLVFGSSGFETAGDDVVTFSGVEKGYENVEPGEAVLVDVINQMDDSDWMISHDFKITTAKKGTIRIHAFRGKGHFGGMTLLWDTGEPAPDCRLLDPESSE
ncbi:MAG: hypothetical protein R3D65_19090 [Zhengella sp.]|uniref:hypothetical protein n=1 Tax=Zhengella sp. TaxID=2282762 RepID=UPI001D254F59|nr:hypothetical protein [Notoacmeibacter sp.]MCC0026660.1 hypothetical protein [Brucellaceae bacterium]